MYSNLIRRFAAVACRALVVSCAVLAASATAWACPGCKEALASSDGGDLVGGFFWSILFMMGMPFAIFGTFAGSMYMAVRRARSAAESHPQTRYPENSCITRDRPLANV